MKKILGIGGAFALIWIFATLIAVLTLPTGTSELYTGGFLIKYSENSFSFPIASPGSYCESWKFTEKKLYWTDMTTSYSSKKISEYGWKRLNDVDQGVGLVFSSRLNLNYTEMKWVKIQKSKTKEQDHNQLFLIPQEASFIFTRMYTFKGDEGDNYQTARLGVDYACSKQLFNHVPGASAFCRKDYLQIYLNDYKKRYEELGLSSCYESLTPKSYLLKEPEHCYEFIKVTERIVKNKNNATIEWLIKSALRHKGYGISLLDYELAKYYYDLYTNVVSCDDSLSTHKELIVQKYISNPALIEGRKFDFRLFLVCINADPLVVGWAPRNGHTRLSDQIFDKNSKDFTTHITANVAGENPESLEFLKKYRFNLKEIGEYFKSEIGNVDEWLEKIAFPKLKKILIHMFRATQQNFLVKRPGLFEFYGVDFLMDDTYSNFYLLESNRRPDVQEKNPDLQYREDMILQDLTKIADYFLENNVVLKSTQSVFSRLLAFEPLIDETQEDPYFGVLDPKCSLKFDDHNPNLPIDPMIEPLKYYIETN